MMSLDDIAVSESESETLFEVLTKMERHLSVIADYVSQPVAKSTRKYDNPSTFEIATIVKRIISEHGVAMSASEVYEALLSKGVILQGKDPMKIMVTALWRRRDLVVRLDNRQGYWVADRAYIPVVT
jgi:hypothetical protein